MIATSKGAGREAIASRIDAAAPARVAARSISKRAAPTAANVSKHSAIP